LKYSIELVPRSWETLQHEVEEVSQFKQIKTLNIPDLLRFDIRSWDACQRLQTNFEDVIPHLRAIDFDLKNGFPLTEFFLASGITSVLVVEGDPPQDLSHRTYRNTSCELIRIIKKELPHMKVYAAIDQYRTSMRKELDYIHDKVDAGVDGFFTQPFFDLNLLELYMDMLQNVEVFWGMSPIHSVTSQSYWENKNDVVFPSDFEATKEWNINFGRAMINKIKAKGDNVYFMPIRANATEYLAALLAD
jgi:methylenetetrahydrofolate reductase (NADPH)